MLTSGSIVSNTIYELVWGAIFSSLLSCRKVNWTEESEWESFANVNTELLIITRVPIRESCLNIIIDGDTINNDVLSNVNS